MLRPTLYLLFFFFNDTATTEIYTLSLHDALPISSVGRNGPRFARIDPRNGEIERAAPRRAALLPAGDRGPGGRGSGAAGDPDRKSTRLNSSHLVISYAVFCLKKKKRTT